MAGVQRRLQRLHRLVQELIQEDRVQEAERVLDEALKLFEEKRKEDEKRRRRGPG